ncbi:Peptidoglycan-binding lysin domain protein [Desulfotomaculum nigrificans CO-1-SRB]|uniref:Peptidoglycan-binding lysin domain protein n=1 Tax=Desulfotomaculum nigrificans (strain DSM 14880 / VKM B-2319 / CO-1-SRB) TaxID=868595 RepID=F6B4F2_DESCC|nr:SPOCS domain-containing protein [Desulfotomaculum nigrificans]AEF92975.1 Peptidoglycan-binding lysin domain protein [Desulfotomaculum nigrificans CO-1-SRB]
MAMKKRPKPKYRQRLGETTTTRPVNTVRLNVEEVVAENTEQTIVRGKISGSDVKPEVDKILSTDATGKVKKVEVIPDKVIIEGILKLEVLYSAFKEDQSVHTFRIDLPFTDFVEVRGARPGMNADIDIVVEDVSLTRDPKCADDWDVAAVLKVTARITETREVNAVTECPTGFKCETERMKVKHLVGSGNKQVLIDKYFELPPDTPDVDRVRRCSCDVEITDTRIIKDKVLFDGKVTLECTYTALKDHKPVHTFERTFKFNDFIEIKGAEKDMDVDVDAMVESCTVEVAEGNACKLDVTIVLNVKVRVSEERDVDVVTDIEGATVKTAPLSMESPVGEKCKQVVIRDAAEIPAGKPDVDKVREITARNFTITDVDIVPDKVLVRGKVEFEVMYKSMKPDHAVHMLHRKVHFKTFIDVPGARSGDNVDVDINVEWANAKMDGCDLVIEAVLEVCAKVTETIEREVVIEYTLPKPTAPPTTAPPGACVPGTTFNYTIVQGDTLNKLAARFGTTVQDILNVNPQITNPNLINVGDVIKIPCVAKG